MFYNRHVVATVTLLISTIDALAVLPAQLLNSLGSSLARPLQFSAVTTTGTPLPSSSSPSAASTGTSNVNLTASTRNQISTNCDENLYGQPIVKSCLYVYTQLSDDDTVVEFGDRTRGIYDYPLPYRFISTDGKCVLDIEASPGAYGDKATMAQISAAALHLLNTCVLPKRAGGKSTGYGEKAGLSITIEEYKPHVVCQEHMSKYENVDECRELLSMMPASEDIQVFGKQGDRGVDVGLPFDLAGPSGECGFFFNTNGAPQRTNWHELWQSATAIWGICGTKHQQGLAFAGLKGSINVAMYRPSDSLLTLNSTVNGISYTAR